MTRSKAIRLSKRVHGDDWQEHVRDDYSGRGMCGEVTWAVVVSPGEAKDQSDRNGYHRDSMGLDAILY